MDTSNFYEKVTSNLIVPLITIPTKINTKNDTLIHNIFSNFLQPGIVSGNSTVNFSDGHLPSFAIFQKSKVNQSCYICSPKSHLQYLN